MDEMDDILFPTQKSNNNSESEDGPFDSSAKKDNDDGSTPGGDSKQQPRSLSEDSDAGASDAGASQDGQERRQSNEEQDQDRENEQDDVKDDENATIKEEKTDGGDTEEKAAAAAAARKQKTKKELEEEEREKMQVLVSNFTEDQLDRYEMYRRAAFPKAAVKRLMQTITGCSVSQNVVIAMSGIAKVFVGEIVEEALDVMETSGETGALQPKYLREAVRRLRVRGHMPIGKCQKPYFRLN